VLVAPFLMRFRLGARTFGGEVGTRLREAVREALPDFDVQDTEPDSPMLFDYHVSTGGSRLSGEKTVGTVTVGAAGGLWIRFDPRGVCAMMRISDVENGEGMQVGERELVNLLTPHVRRWVDAISATMISSGLVDAAGPDTMEQGMLLWWHRVLIDPPRDQEPA